MALYFKLLRQMMSLASLASRSEDFVWKSLSQYFPNLHTKHCLFGVQWSTLDSLLGLFFFMPCIDLSCNHCKTQQTVVWYLQKLHFHQSMSRILTRRPFSVFSQYILFSNVWTTVLLNFFTLLDFRIFFVFSFFQLKI